MQDARPDPLLQFLAAGVSVVYVALWIGVAVVLLGLPLVRSLAAESSSFSWGMPAPVRMADAEAAVATMWGSARLEVEDVRGDLRLPIPKLPWWVVGVLWAYACVGAVLMLSFLYQFRQVLRRARDGAPFDPDNARRLRWLGVLLLAMAVVNGAAEFATAAIVRAGLADAEFTVPGGLHVDGRLAILALVLLALARVFHRGAELEREQALVV
jgi:hypothetical protein